MGRAAEVKTGKPSKADAHMDADKMVKKQMRKEEKKRRRNDTH